MPSCPATSNACPCLDSIRRADGFTLVELLVGLALLAVLLGGIAGPLVAAGRSQASTANYSYAQQKERAGLNEVVSQVRQSWEVLSDTPNSVQLNVTQGGISEQVYYECDLPQPGTQYHECVRVTAAVGASLPPLSGGTVVIDHLLNGSAADPVFSFAPSAVAPYYMTATIKLPASAGGHYGLGSAVVFSDGALMRNLNVGN